MRSLLEAFPDIAAQWDYEHNGGLTPSDVSYGSNKIVWWKCTICGHSYKKKIANRTAPAKRKTESDKCPICLGRIIIPGFNSLKAKFPEIIEREWDYKKNAIDPDSIPPTYRKKVWWLCPNGHSYNSLPGNKIYHTGGDCPYCSSQKLCKETSLGYVNPELVKEWHPTKNGNLTPLMYSPIPINISGGFVRFADTNGEQREVIELLINEAALIVLIAGVHLCLNSCYLEQ